MEMDQKTYEAYAAIFFKTIRNYVNARGIQLGDEEDDIFQESFMEILEYEKENGEFPDYALAKTMCQRNIVDAIRKSINKGSKIDQLDNYIHSSDEEGDQVGFDRANITAIQSQQEDDAFFTEYQDLIDRFPEGSKEQIYLKYYLEKAGLADFGFNPDSSEYKGGYKDGKLAELLGFKGGTGSRGWKEFKAYMQDVIDEFFGRK